MKPRGFIAIPIILLILGVLAVGTVVVVIVTHRPSASSNANAVACTQEAKLCPDGSAVGRTDPNCEFATCPGTSGNTNVPQTNGGTVFNGTVDFSSIESIRGLADTGATTVIGKVLDAQGTVLSSIELRVVDGYFKANFAREPNGTTGTFEVYKRLSNGTEQMFASAPMKLSVIVTDAYQESTNTSDPTAGWKTYTNTTHGYSMQYPTNWALSDILGPKTIQIIPPDAASKTTIELGPTLFAQYEDQIVPLSPSVRDRVTTTINGLPATQQKEGGMGDSLTTYFQLSTGGFIAVSWDLSFSYAEYQQILSTFRFTE